MRRPSPPSSTVYVDNPTSGQHDISGLLHGHLASLAAYRSLQVAPGSLPGWAGPGWSRGWARWEVGVRQRKMGSGLV